MAMSEDVKPFCWNDKKNIQLQAEREINFEMVVSAITEGNVLDIIENQKKEKYPSQRIFVIRINQYVYLVPFVENDQEIFLKTIISSRKMKEKYLGD